MVDLKLLTDSFADRQNVESIIDRDYWLNID